MEKFKQICKKIFCLPFLPTVLIAVPSFTLCFVLLGVGGKGVLSYISYALSAYAMIITVTAVIKFCKIPKKSIFELSIFQPIRKISVGKRYLDDETFRSEVSLYTGLFINFAYVIIKLFSGIYYHSIWFAALSVYYLFLSVIRFLLLHHVRKSPIGNEYYSELKRYRLCGIMLMIMNVALGVIVTLVVVQNEGFQYAGFLIYIMAIYTFYAVITSVVNLIKFRKYKSPILSAAKVINLTAALVSMLSLETAMLSQFDPSQDITTRRTFTATTGFVVCVFVLGASIYMIMKANKKLKSRDMRGECDERK